VALKEARGVVPSEVVFLEEQDTGSHKADLAKAILELMLKVIPPRSWLSKEFKRAL
jgi:hypothetical protein